MQDKPEMDEVQSVMSGVTLSAERDSGGFKVVYEAEIEGTREALKLVRIPVDEDDPSVEEENIKRLIREISILGKCNSPFLVKLGRISPVECQIDSKKYIYYSEELLEGDSLKTKISNGHRPEQTELASLCVCLLHAIKELDSNNVIHRDIKPGNIVTNDLRKRPFVLLDLGLAFLVGGSLLTCDARGVPGTRYYIAPEMLDEDFRSSLDYRADLYAIGLTLYEYAVGSNPFYSRRDAQYTTLYRIKHEQPMPLYKIRNDLDMMFCNLIDQLMKKLPALRPANINNLIKQVEGYLS